MRELAEHFTVDGSIISRHLNAIGKVRKLDKWMPHELTTGQMLKRHDTSVPLRLRNLRKPSLNKISTKRRDEKRVLYDNRRRSVQRVIEIESPKKMPKPSLHLKKAVVTV